MTTAKTDLAAVLGGVCLQSMASFENACLAHISEEQRRANPDTALVGLLCDAVRLKREHCAGKGSTKCTWRYDRESMFWKSTCGQEHGFDVGPIEHGWKFCPFCGAAIAEASGAGQRMPGPMPALAGCVCEGNATVSQPVVGVPGDFVTYLATPMTVLMQQDLAIEDGCACAVTDERVIRAWAAAVDGMPAMTSEQRAWCIAEVVNAGDSTTQIPPEHLEKLPDDELASVVLRAWQDYCRDTKDCGRGGRQMPEGLDDADTVKAALQKDPTGKTWWCTVCGRNFAPGGVCSDCRRHLAIGRLVVTIISEPDEDITGRKWPVLAWRGGLEGRLVLLRPLSALKLNALDAISELLGPVSLLRRQHHREIRDEQRGAQQDARAAYRQGQADSSRED